MANFGRIYSSSPKIDNNRHNQLQGYLKNNNYNNKHKTKVICLATDEQLRNTCTAKKIPRTETNRQTKTLVVEKCFFVMKTNCFLSGTKTKSTFSISIPDDLEKPMLNIDLTRPQSSIFSFRLRADGKEESKEGEILPFPPSQHTPRFSLPPPPPHQRAFPLPRAPLQTQERRLGTSEMLNVTTGIQKTLLSSKHLAKTRI